MTQEIVHTYTKTYQQLKKALGWKVPNKQATMMIASTYVTSKKTFHLEHFLTIARKIRSEARLFSSMRTHSRFMIAAQLDINVSEPSNHVPKLFDHYRLFRNEKFRSGVFTYIAATLLLMSNQEDPLPTIRKAKSIYDRMKENHPFITSTSDYPLATLLSIETDADVLSQMERLYQALNNNGFHKGNDLQLLSHILSLHDSQHTDTIVNRATTVFDSFKRIGIKPKKAYYPVIGVLALLPEEAVNINDVQSIYNALLNQKDFKWQKDMNVMLAVQLYMKEKIEHDHLLETSLFTIVESIIQAQQAVMIAAVAGASATAASSSSS